MKHFDRDTDQRTIPQGHAMVHTAMSLRHNLSDLFSLLGVANMGHLFVFYIHNRGSEWKISWQQARGHCRNDFVMNDFPVLPHTAALWSIRKAFHSLKRRIPNAVCEKQTQLLLKGAGITLLTLIGLGTDSQAFKTNKKMHFFLHFMWRCDLSIII